MKRQSPLLSNGLWFDSDAEQAVQFYQSVFPDTKVNQVTYYGKEGFEIHGRPEGSVMSVNFELSGTQFQAINGGPVFQINPSISYFIICETPAEADGFWNVLVEGANVLMPIDTYDWSARYGWLQDKYGLSWQIHTGERNSANQKVCPCLMFVGKQHGRAEEAIRFYTTIFKESAVEGIMRYPAGGTDPEGTVMHSQFTLHGQVFMAMDSAWDHAFQFNEGVSFIVNCTTQEEIDYYWDKLTEGGKEVECGWLEDKFGISWQVVPVQLDEMLNNPDKEKTERVTKAFLKMKKMDLQALKDAFNG